MKIATTTNLLVRSFFIFVIAFLWVGFYIRGFILVFFLSFSITVGMNYAISFFVGKRTQRKTTTKKHLEHIGTVTLQLKFMTKTQTLSLFKAALCEKYKCTASTKKLMVQTQSKILEIFSLFHKGTITEADIIECIKASRSESQILVTAEAFSPAVAVFARSLKVDIKLLDAIAVYNQILAPVEIFPKVLVETKKNAKLSLRELKEIAFSRTRTKTYVITAIVILFSSLIIRLSIYYLIVATIVFGLALSSHLSPLQNKSFFD